MFRFFFFMIVFGLLTAGASAEEKLKSQKESSQAESRVVKASLKEGTEEANQNKNSEQEGATEQKKIAKASSSQETEEANQNLDQKTKAEIKSVDMNLKMESEEVSQNATKQEEELNSEGSKRTLSSKNIKRIKIKRDESFEVPETNRSFVKNQKRDSI